MTASWKPHNWDTLVRGDQCPAHLHTHLIPRYFTDDAPNRPIDPTPAGREVYLLEAF